LLLAQLDYRTGHPLAASPLEQADEETKNPRIHPTGMRGFLCWGYRTSTITSARRVHVQLSDRGRYRDVRSEAQRAPDGLLVSGEISLVRNDQRRVLPYDEKSGRLGNRVRGALRDARGQKHRHTINHARSTLDGARLYQVPRAARTLLQNRDIEEIGWMHHIRAQSQAIHTGVRRRLDETIEVGAAPHGGSKAR